MADSGPESQCHHKADNAFGRMVICQHPNIERQEAKEVGSVKIKLKSHLVTLQIETHLVTLSHIEYQR